MKELLIKEKCVICGKDISEKGAIYVGNLPYCTRCWGIREGLD